MFATPPSNFQVFTRGSRLHTRVNEFRRVFSEILSKGRRWVVSWRATGREWVPGLGDSRGVAWRGDANRMTGDCLVLTVLCSMILLMIGGTEQHTGRVVEVENTVQLLGTGCCRILPSQT